MVCPASKGYVIKLLVTGNPKEKWVEEAKVTLL